MCIAKTIKIDQSDDKEKELKELRHKVDTLELQINSIKEAHVKELVDLEYSLKIQYEDILKARLREQKIEFEVKMNKSASCKVKSSEYGPIRPYIQSPEYLDIY